LKILFLGIGLVEWLEKRQLSCFYKSTLGVECPGCGIQRAILALLRGEFVESFKLFPALMPTVAMLIFLVVHLLYRLKHGAKILVTLFVFNVAVIFISYICKLIV